MLCLAARLDEALHDGLVVVVIVQCRERPDAARTRGEPHGALGPAVGVADRGRHPDDRADEAAFTEEASQSVKRMEVSPRGADDDLCARGADDAVQALDGSRVDLLRFTTKAIRLRHVVPLHHVAARHQPVTQVGSAVEDTVDVEEENTPTSALASLRHHVFSSSAPSPASSLLAIMVDSAISAYHHSEHSCSDR